MGNEPYVRKVLRDLRLSRVLDTFAQDLRYASRSLWRKPALTIVAVLSLAVSIGGATTVFAIIDALALRRLPVTDPDRLVTLEWDAGSTRLYGVDTSEFHRYRELARDFSRMAGVELVDRWNADFGTGPSSVLHIGLVSANYFDALGIEPSGTSFANGDDEPGLARSIAVISDAFRQRQFGRDAKAVGRTFRLNRTVYTIVGVAPEGFTGDWIGRPVDLWIPLGLHAQVMPEAAGRFDLRLIGRLASGITPVLAAADAQVVYDRIKQAWSASGRFPKAVQDAWPRRVQLESMAHGYSPQRATLERPLAILASLVTCLLLIACTNIASLLLARAHARRRELAVRRALGAHVGRLLRQLLTESIVLAMIGGVAGTILAWWSMGVLARFVSVAPAPFLGSEAGSTGLVVALDASPDLRVLAFAFGLCLTTSILFGLIPAVRGANTSLAPALRTRGAAAAGRRSLDELLGIAQVAIAVVMLVGAGLAMTTLRDLRTQKTGVDHERLLIAWTDPSALGLHGAPLTDVWHRVRDQLGALPGVRRASVSSMGLFNGFNASTGSEFFARPGVAPRSGRMLVNTKVTRGYFATVGTPILDGRDFSTFDADSTPPVVILNETMARFYFGGEDPIGKRLDFTRPHTYAPYTVVGVVRDAKNSPREGKTGAIYYPSTQHFGGNAPTMVVVLRTNGDPNLLKRRVADVIRSAVPGLPVLQVDTMDEQMDIVLAPDRLISACAEFFGIVCGLLACLGIYGIISYSTRERTSEIGIRMALGATSGRVLREVLAQSAALVATGSAVGLGVALGFGRLVGHQLYGVSASDPKILIGAVAVMGAVAGFAGFLPARRAARIDPLIALRSE